MVSLYCRMFLCVYVPFVKQRRGLIVFFLVCLIFCQLSTCLSSVSMIFFLTMLILYFIPKIIYFRRKRHNNYLVCGFCWHTHGPCKSGNVFHSTLFVVYSMYFNHSGTGPSFYFDLVRNIIQIYPKGDLFHFSIEIFVGWIFCYIFWMCCDAWVTCANCMWLKCRRNVVANELFVVVVVVLFYVLFPWMLLARFDSEKSTNRKHTHTHTTIKDCVLCSIRLLCCVPFEFMFEDCGIFP